MCTFLLSSAENFVISAVVRWLLTADDADVATTIRVIATRCPWPDQRTRIREILRRCERILAGEPA